MTTDGVKPTVAVVGAGAFGGWSALSLLRRGARVVLLDAWGAGNSRSSSGGETRVIRAGYGNRHDYIPMVSRAFDLWRENERRWGADLLRQTGVLWMFPGDSSFITDSLQQIHEHDLRVERIDRAEAERRYPAVSFDGIREIYFESTAGYLRARLACGTVLESFVAEGGDYRPLSAEPGSIANGSMKGIRLSDGSNLEADAFVFACGPWLPGLFPEVLEDKIAPTRQDVFFFGLPAGDPRLEGDRFPIWIEVGDAMIYGIPASEHRGFKAADDTRGRPIDPSNEDRLPLPESLDSIRRHIARRFPTLRDAPLVETRVCQYEETPDGEFIVDRHPGAANVWIVGGGSGHGFKFGPVIGENIAAHLLDDLPPRQLFSLSRFK